MGWIRRRVAPAACALAIAGAVSAAPVHAASPALVAFASDASGTYDLYVVRLDGSGLRRLTDGPQTDTSPAWSPDGRRLVFWSHLAGTSQLSVVDVDGRNRRELAVNTQPDTLHRVFPPAWSPDGRWIVFESNRDAPPGATQTDLYVVRPDGTGLRRITADRVLTAAPSWSPDGRKVVYSQQFGTDSQFPEIFERPAADSGARARRLTSDVFHDWDATWSPDGRSLAWMSNRTASGAAGTAFRIHVRTGSGRIRLVTPTTGNATAQSPSWTPDGASLVFSKDPDGPMSVSVGYFGGTDVRVVPGGPAPARLHVIAVDGRHERPLTQATSNAITPAVQPRP